MKAARHERRAIGIGKDQRLLRRHVKGLVGTIILNVARRRLTRQPLTHITFGRAGAFCQLLRRGSTLRGQRLVQSQLMIADDHAGTDKGRSLFCNHFAQQFLQFCIVHGLVLLCVRK